MRDGLEMLIPAVLSLWCSSGKCSGWGGRGERGGEERGGGGEEGRGRGRGSGGEGSGESGGWRAGRGEGKEKNIVDVTTRENAVATTISFIDHTNRYTLVSAHK